MSGECRAAAVALGMLAAVAIVLAGAPEPARAGNGCGPAGFGFLVPDRPLGFDFHAACERHDACYTTPGSAKRGCDGAFLWDLDDACLAAAAGRRVELCLRVALDYYRAVSSWIGDLAFGRAQRAASRVV